SQQELFEQKKYISDLIEEKSEKKRSSLNIILGSSLVSSGIILSFLFLFGIFDEEEVVLPEPITITETVREKELVMPRVDSTEVVSIAELATKTIVQVQVGTLSEDGEFFSAGGGSGVVISNEGLIMTNHHVIDNSTEVRVIFEDGRLYEATIIGSDKLTDIGLIKINASNLIPIAIGNSDNMLVGDLAVAIGHPLTLGAAPTVTTGVVSALERRLDVGGDTMDSAVTLFGLIQTDAPITRGSSGGALINKNGELIGITTAIATADVGAEGLGFAVPVNLALGIAEDLISDGKILHAFLGILGAQHFETAADGARVFSGVFIQELYGPGGETFAIGKAGALPGDVIKAINGENVKTLDGLITILRTKRAGDQVEIQIMRDSQAITLVFQLDLRPSDV
ncbi:MAG: trypsin-like peptidase domain-containing protein, partial [Candidatus Actinomarinales bacterium]|nr:trypsin-like peptidase domain-containing protein [Candidatus Actinomarinales bacterium]